jgi:hypothetical protein
MPIFRVHRMKDAPRQQFRWAPHVTGCATVKAKDFERDGEVEARNEYHAWQILKESSHPLEVGDLLELEDGQLRVCKYVGLEPAQWFVPEPKPPAETLPVESEPPAPPAEQVTAS